MSGTELGLRGTAIGTAAGALVVLGGAAVVATTAGRVPYGDWLPLVLVPVIMVVTLPVLRRVAEECDDPPLFAILVAALSVKLVGALVRHHLAFDVYGGNADAGTYHQWGVSLSEAFRSGSLDTGLHSWTDTDFVRILTGAVYTIMGPSLLGGFLVFAWMAFAGQLLFHRAFVRGVPDGRHRRYAYLVHFLPTMVFWPSSIGKEAWMILALGLAVYGAVRLLEGAVGAGLPLALAGLALAGVVRPHVAVMATIGLFVALLARRGRDSPLGPAVRVAGLALVALAAVVAVEASQDLLQAEDATTALEFTADRTSGGDSSFDPVLVRGPADLPLAFVTVLFRPHPLEAHNLQAGLSALEGLALAALGVAAIPSLLRGLRRIRERPLVALAVTYTLAFVVAYSSIANFGILVRQRSQLVPVFLVLLALPRTVTPGTRTGSDP